MYWRIGEDASESGKPALVYDEVKHRLRAGAGPWVPLARNPALILSLLVRMQEQGRSASSAEVCAFLDLPEGSRVSGYVTELRKKIAQCGVAGESVLANISNTTGYQLVPGVRAARVASTDELKLLDELIAGRRIPRRKLRAQLRELRAMLVVCAAAALAYTGWLTLPDGDEVAFTRLDPRDPQARRAHLDRRRCYALGRELGLRAGDALVLELSPMSASAPARVEITLERERRDDGYAEVPALLAPGRVETLRIDADKIDAGVRAHARRLCFEGGGDSSGAGRGSVAIELRALRIE